MSFDAPPWAYDMNTDYNEEALLERLVDNAKILCHGAAYESRQNEYVRGIIELICDTSKFLNVGFYDTVADWIFNGTKIPTDLELYPEY